MNTQTHKLTQLKHYLIIMALFAICIIKINAQSLYIHMGTTTDLLNGVSVDWNGQGTADSIKWGYTTVYEKGKFLASKRAAVTFTGEWFHYNFGNNITPSATIYYALYDSKTKAWSAQHKYNTVAAIPTDTASASFSFAAAGDSRDGAGEYTTIANSMNAKKPSFVLFNGDITADGNVASEWTTWFNSADSLAYNKVMFQVEGNHDAAAPTTYLNMFDLPTNGDGTDYNYYSFVYGNTEFIVLNFEYGDVAPANSADWTAQTTFLTNVLKAVDTNVIKWTVVSWHEPYYTCGEHIGDMTYPGWWPVFDKYGLDLVLNGHDHSYQRFLPITQNGTQTPATAPVSKYGSWPGQGRCEIISGGAGAPLYTETTGSSDPNIPMLKTFQSTNNFLICNEAGCPTGGSGYTYMHLIAYNDAGTTVLDSLTLSKPCKPQSTCSISASAATTINIKCNGSNNGIATASITSGTSPYTYSWTGGQTNATATGLSAGTYTVTVKDKNGCSATAATVVTEPTALTASGSVTSEANCGGNTGTASSTVSGGTSPYTYSWTGGQTTANATGLSAGTYTVTITDNNGCTKAATITITQTTGISSLSATTTANIKCNGSNVGTATASTTSGTPPYTYSWTGGQTNATATGLSAGTYTVTIKDKNGCSGTASTVVTEPTTLTASGNVTTNDNCGGNNGSASASVSGGTSPYTYSWTGGQTGATATGLSAGTYTVNVTDNNGCTKAATVAITQTTTLASVSATTTTNVKCNGLNDGTATASTTSGTSPYTYSWTGGQTNATATGLSAGTYTVTIKDKNGCTGTALTVITEPATLTASGSVTSEANCGGNTGSASSNVNGGTSPYTYSWTGGQTGATVTGLSAGTYILNVTDNNGCTYSATVTITQSSSLGIISTNVTSNVQCNGASNGSVTASTSSGTPPYTYSWTAGAGTNATANGLSAGTYIVIITDHNGCSGTASAVITQPNILTASGSVTANDNCGGNNGSALASAGGGTSPYTYSWTGGQTNATATGLSAGTYTVNVTDNNGCSKAATVTITQTTTLASVSATTTSNVKCNGSNDGAVNASTTSGTSPYTYSWTGGQSNATATGLSAGTYIVIITDKNGCTGTASTVVTEPAGILTTVNTVSASTDKACDGQASVSVSGGTVPYTYNWSPGSETTDTIKAQCANEYCCTITDNNGCIETTCATISGNSTGVADINNTSNISIFPDPTTGEITVSGTIKGQAVELYNTLGQELTNVLASGSTTYFNITNQPDGIYLVRIVNKDGTIVTQQKIVKAQ